MSLASKYVTDRFEKFAKPVQVGGMKGILYDPSPNLHTHPLPLSHNDNGAAMVPAVTISSIYPGELYYKVVHAGTRWYWLPPVPKGEFRALRVYDSFEYILDSPDTITPAGLTGSDSYRAVKIPCMELGRNIVRQFAGDGIDVDGFGLGIGIAAGILPTEEELATATERLTSRFQSIIREADSLYAEERFREITSRHRLALEWMEDFDETRHPWHKEIRRHFTKICMACGASIPESAIRCRHCNANLDEWCATRGIDPKDDPYLTTAIARLIAVRTQSPQAPRAKVPA